MDLDIQIRKPDWDPNPNKTTTNNHNWRKCVIVEFPSGFKWIPTYKQLVQIYQALDKVERINREVAKANFSGGKKMDMEKFEEGEFLTADMIEKSPTKTIVFLNSGELKKTDYGEKVQFLVGIDEKQKVYTPNRKSIGNLNKGFGTNSALWVEKKAKMHVEVIQQKNSIIAEPITPEGEDKAIPEEKVEAKE